MDGVWTLGLVETLGILETGGYSRWDGIFAIIYDDYYSLHLLPPYRKGGPRWKDFSDVMNIVRFETE